MDTLPLRSISPARLRRFEACPRQVWFEEFAPLKPAAAANTPALVLGRSVHAALAHGFRLPPEKRTLSEFEDAVRLAWRRYRRPYPFRHRDEERRVGQGAIEMVRFAAATGWEAGVVAIEASVGVNLPGGTRITGRVDRVDQTPGGLVVIDYKTAGDVPDEYDLRSDPAARCYLLAVEASLGPVSEVRFEYLHAQRAVSWHPEREDLPYIAETLQGEAEAVWQRDRFEATPGRHCQWCPFLRYCGDGWMVARAA